MCKIKSILAIATAVATVGLATVGVLSVPQLSALSDIVPLKQGRTPGWQMPMQHGQMMQASNEFEFLSMMIPHHEEAIATANRVLEYSDRPEMRAFAQDIIDVQSAEIEQMEAWLDEWYPGQESSLIYVPMMRDISDLEGDELDRVFLEDMIRHHMGAVMMSQMLVNHGLVEHQPVQPFAQNIANTQRQEIWQMRNWLQDWYGVADMPGRPYGGHHGGPHGGRGPYGTPNDGQYRTPRQPGMGGMHRGW